MGTLANSPKQVPALDGARIPADQAHGVFIINTQSCWPSRKTIYEALKFTVAASKINFLQHRDARCRLYKPCVSPFFASLSQLGFPISPLSALDQLTPMPILKFREDGTFHVSVFLDTHLAMCAWHPGCLLQDKKGVKVISDVLDMEKPDFAVFNGDLFNADSAFKHNASHCVDRLVKPLVDRGLTWGSTYGNHDHQTQLNGDTLLAREEMFPGVRTARMGQGDVGTTNHYLPVYLAGCTSGRDLRNARVLLDKGHGQPNQLPQMMTGDTCLARW